MFRSNGFGLKEYFYEFNPGEHEWKTQELTYIINGGVGLLVFSNLMVVTKASILQCLTKNGPQTKPLTELLE